jgi:hypothetical protein
VGRSFPLMPLMLPGDKSLEVSLTWYPGISRKECYTNLRRISYNWKQENVTITIPRQTTVLYSYFGPSPTQWARAHREVPVGGEVVSLATTSAIP